MKEREGRRGILFQAQGYRIPWTWIIQRPYLSGEDTRLRRAVEQSQGPPLTCRITQGHPTIQ